MKFELVSKGCDSNLAHPSNPVIGEYADYHREHWKPVDGQWVWDSRFFESEEESQKWLKYTQENGSLFGTVVGDRLVARGRVR